MPTPKKIYLISDSTGELGERFTNALVSQFPNNRILIKKFNFVLNSVEAKKIFKRVSAKDSILFHTVMSKELKKTLRALSRSTGIHAFDLTGPPTDFLMRYLDVKPVWDVQRIHAMNDEYHRRIDAIEYTMSHDDGLGRGSLRQADIILIGPSRTSKTPTSVYLAIKGYRVANVPLVPEVPVFGELTQLAGDCRVVGLAIHPEKLREVRLRRAAELGTTPRGYTELEPIRKEIIFARKVYDKFRWKTIDVSNRAIEETAALIMRAVKE